MVYKIRNKSFFWTRGGWYNNWHPKNFNAPRPSNSETTVGIRCRYDHHSFLRGTQSLQIASISFLQKNFKALQAILLWQQGA
jgi:hypothetical protein